MRELRVISVDTDGGYVVCQDPDNGEKFRIPADERLRAAARGDLSRLGQIQVTAESALRPREIQAHIRAGATVAEVAAMAGVSLDRIERFAHPVLLERTRAAEMAAASHPVQDDGPAPSTLGELSDESLVLLGINPTDADWDAWKADDGYWVVQLRWQVGHTEHYAHWRYLPGAHGGTTDPLDELAYELIHPELVRRHRPLAAVQPPTPQVTIDEAGHEAVTLDADTLIEGQRDRRNTHRATTFSGDPIDTAAAEYPSAAETDPADPGPVVREPASVVEFPAVDDAPLREASDISRSAPETGAAEAEPHPETEAADPSVAATAGVDTTPADTGIVPTVETDGVATESALEGASEPASPPNAPTDDEEEGGELDLELPAGRPQAEQPPAPAKHKRKRSKPSVPAWEDVLLGVRSHPND